MRPSLIPKNSQIDIQTFRPVTTSRQTNKQETSNRNNFSDHIYIFFQKSKTTKPPNTNSQNQSQSQSQNVPQQASQSVFLTTSHELHWIVAKNYPFVRQNKNIANKHNARNQPHYSENYEYSYQNQRLNTNNHHNNWNIDQPDLFEPYTRNKKRQTKHHPTS